MIMDEAEDGEEGQRTTPYVAPGSRSPSPTALAAVYTQVQGASELSQATLESLERGRQTMEEGKRMAARTRMILDRERSGSKKTPSGAHPLTIAGGPRQEDAGCKSGTQTEGTGLRHRRTGEGHRHLKRAWTGAQE